MRGSPFLLVGLLVQGAPASGIDLADLDPGVRAQDDLYRHANGGWLARTAIPAEAVTWTAASEIAARVEVDLRTLIEDLTKDGRSVGGTARLIADLYASITDVSTIEARGAAPIAPALARISAIGGPRDLAAEAGRLSAEGAAGPFGVTLSADPADPRGATVQISPGGIMLPSPEYYTSADRALGLARDRYIRYLTSIFTLVGHANAPAAARGVLAIETSLARAHPRPDPQRAAGAHRYTLADLTTRMPGFDWHAWAEPQGVRRRTVVLVSEPEFFVAFAALISSAPIDDWRSWLAARVITAQAPFLSRKFDDARFDFFGRELTGQEAPRERWRRGVALVNTYLGDAIGRLYVERHFPASSARRVSRIVDEVIDAYRETLAESTWLSAPARAMARRKLDAIERKIGYPATWRSYRDLEIRPDDLVGNIERAKKSESAYRLRTVARAPTARGWLMPPQTVNAYYNTGFNEIVLPAAILQPPYFDPRADEAVNFGAVGALVAHEISHAFMGPGRLVTAEGRAVDWWTPADVAAFDRVAAQVMAQYNAFELAPGLMVDGARTLAENLCDLAGVAVAYRAYERSRHGRPAPVLEGLTGDQRFFLGWAQIWRARTREAAERQQSALALHAPGPFRANGPIVHLEAFARAFDVKPGDGLFREPAARIRIW